MAKEPRPKGYPKLKNYKPSQFMLPTSHYDKKKADRAVTFIENLCHTKDRQLYDVLTKGSSDARQNPLHFIITTAGNDRHSIAFELHIKAVDILEGRRVDPTFYPVVYGLKDDEDWEEEANWYKVNPSLGYTVDIERLRDAYREAKQNPADEITFKWLRMNMWVSSTTAWIPDAIYMRGNEPIDMDALEGRDCYAGLDLSSTGDITALVLMFPPRDMDEKYIVLPFFWVPEDTIPRRVKANSVPYDVWEKQGHILSTEGNVIHYDFIEKFIYDLAEKYHILEIAVDRWNATQMIQNLEGEGFTIVPFGQGFSSMSAPTKEFYRLLMEGQIIHGGHIATCSFNDVKTFYQDSYESLLSLLMIPVCLDNIITRSDYQSFSTTYDDVYCSPKFTRNLRWYRGLDNGTRINKLDETEAFQKMISLPANRLLRNGIGHNNIQYDSISQIITAFDMKKKGKINYQDSLMSVAIDCLGLTKTAVILSEIILYMLRLEFRSEGIHSIIHPRFYKGAQPNDKCPCGSGAKYKKCCKNDVERVVRT